MIKKGSIYLLISFLPLAANFLVLPFFTEYLSKTEYGILAMANVIQSYISIFMAFGITSAFSRFYYDYYKKEALKYSLLTSTLFFVSLFIISIGILFFVFGESIFYLLVKNTSELSFTKYGFVIWGLSAILIFYGTIQAFYRNEENIKMFALISISGFFIMLAGSIVGVMVLKLGAYGAMYGKFIGIVGLMTIYFIYLFSTIKFKIRFKFFKPMCKYALPLVPYFLLGVIMNNLDKQFIENYLGLQELGLYNVAFMIGSVPAIFLSASQTTVYPQIFKILSDNENNKYEKVRNLISMLLLFTLLIIAGLISCLPWVTHTFIGNEYQNIIKYVPIITIAYCFRALYVVMIIPIDFEKKTNLLPYTTVVALLVAIVGGLLLIPRFGLYGASVLIVFIQLAQLLTALFFTYKIKWLYKGLFKQPTYYIGMTGIVVLTVLFLVQNNNNSYQNPFIYTPLLFVLILFSTKIKMLKIYLKL